MKRIVIAVVIYLFLISISISSLVMLKQTSQSLYGKLEEMQYYVVDEKFDEAEKSATDFINTWNKEENLLVGYIRHNVLDEITFASSKILPLLEYKRKSDALVIISQLKTFIIHMYSSELPYIQNLY